MKRSFMMILTVILVTALCCTSVFAAGGSKTDVVEIKGATDQNGKEVVVTEKDTTIAVITEEVASKVEGITEEPKQLSVLYQKDLTSETLPVTISFTVDGTEGQKLYVCHHNGTAWEVVAEGVGPTVTATFTSLSPVAVIGTVEKANNGGGQSPTTGSAMGIFVACGIVAAAGAASVAVARKKD